VGPQIEPKDRPGLLRMARYGAHVLVAESRLRYDAHRAEVELVTDRSEGPYPGIHRFSALEFIARRVDHVPERYQVRVRYAGGYATRRRVGWRRRGVVRAGARGEPRERPGARGPLARAARPQAALGRVAAAGVGGGGRDLRALRR
jgi:hypothetical protein